MSLIPRRWLLAVGLWPLIATAGPAAQPQDAPPSSSSQTRRDMQRHDELAEKARAALVARDMDAFRLGMEIAAVQPLPGKNASHASTFVERARIGTEAATVDEAARALGQLGAACATCHLASPAKRYPASGFESGDQDVIDRMQQHWWATDALWQGLVGPDDGAWSVGAKALTDGSLTSMPGFPQTDQARSKAEALQSAARAAMEAPVQVDARGETFARVIRTCADCHTSLNRGPVLPR